MPPQDANPTPSFGGFGLRLTFEIPFAPPVISLPEVVNKWTVLGATLTLLLVSEVGVLSINETVGAKRALRFVLIMLVIGNLSPNPPKDTDGRREESGRGVRELQGK